MLKELLGRTLDFLAPEKEVTGRPERLPKKAGRIYVKCADVAFRQMAPWHLEGEPFGLTYEEIAIAGLRLTELEFERHWQDKVDPKIKDELKKFFDDRYLGFTTCVVWQEGFDRVDEFTQGRIGMLGGIWVTSIKEFAPQLLKDSKEKPFEELVEACRQNRRNRDLLLRSALTINTPVSPQGLDAR